MRSPKRNARRNSSITSEYSRSIMKTLERCDLLGESPMNDCSHVAVDLFIFISAGHHGDRGAVPADIITMCSPQATAEYTTTTGRMADEDASDNGDEELVGPNNQLNIERQGPYIPGVSEAVEFAKKQVLAQLQINKDFHTGIRDAVNQAINSSNPAQAIKTVQEHIKKYFQIEAQRNPFVLVGRLIIKQGQRLSQQVGQMFEQQRRQNQAAKGADAEQQLQRSRHESRTMSLAAAWLARARARVGENMGCIGSESPNTLLLCCWNGSRAPMITRQ
ncbi:unnamed protein product [Trichogramma brassicae]|uniref:Uncharacterized protein n=1 Tax=Trichogramma brassicae TaxID=86971 RepID=A0A6H5I384_9HYME|nr:unnamed protein product [Trichogramma brassicae]